MSRKQIQDLKDYLKGFNEDSIVFYNVQQKVKQIEGLPVSLLAYAQGAYKIQSIAQLPEANKLVEDAVKIVTLYFTDNYLTVNQDEKVIDIATKLKRLILSEYAERMSLFGLIHAFDLMSQYEPPCDTIIQYGDAKAIRQNLNRYCAAAVNAHSKLHEDIQRKKDSEKAINTTTTVLSPSELAAFNDKINRLAKDIDIESQRVFSQKISKGEVDIDLIIKKQESEANEMEQQRMKYKEQEIPFD